jgi:ribosomal protein S2
MEKRCFRVGVILYLNKKKTYITNQNIKRCFFLTLNFWGNKQKDWQPKLFSNLLGVGEKNCILNAEQFIEMLKRITKVCSLISRNTGKFLFINTLCNIKFDGIFKNISFRAGQSCVLGKWIFGSLTKNTSSLAFDAIVLLESKQSNFIIKEANKLGIPIISLNDNSFVMSEVMYPLLCNNNLSDSFLFNSFILSNAIIEGLLYNYIHQIKFLWSRVVWLTH